MAGVEVLSIIAIVVVGAILIPIVFNENPAAFLENSLCVIFGTGGTNTTCNAISGNVTFVGISPVSIIANNSQNTITWSIFANDTNATHQNIGGGAEVFKNETLVVSNWRTLIGGGGVTVIENPETIEIRTGGAGGGPMRSINNPNNQNLFNSTLEGETVVFVGKGIAITNASSVEFALNATISELLNVNATNATNNDILVFNNFTGNWENIPTLNLTRNTFIDNNDFFSPHLAVGLASNEEETFKQGTSDEFEVRVIEFDKFDPIVCAVCDDFASWQYIVPANYEDSDFIFKWYWTLEKDDAGTVCWEFKLMNLEVGFDVDQTFGIPTTICNSTFDPTAVDDLNLDIFVVPKGNHDLKAGDIAIVRIERSSQSNPLDTFDEDVFGWGGELTWIG